MEPSFRRTDFVHFAKQWLIFQNGGGQKSDSQAMIYEAKPWMVMSLYTHVPGTGELFNSTFFQSAQSYYRQKYGRVAFLVVSDDMDWCR